MRGAGEIDTLYYNPKAYWWWGEAMLVRGNLADTTNLMSLAHETNKHFADPLKAWGGVLAKQGAPERHWRNMTRH